MAFVLSRIAHFRYVVMLFDLMASIAALVLVPAKSVAVPLASAFSPNIALSISTAIASMALQWSDIPCAAEAEYLGVWLGPGANAKHWTDQTSKFLNRINITVDSNYLTNFMPNNRHLL